MSLPSGWIFNALVIFLKVAAASLKFKTTSLEKRNSFIVSRMCGAQVCRYFIAVNLGPMCARDVQLMGLSFYGRGAGLALVAVANFVCASPDYI